MEYHMGNDVLAVTVADEGAELMSLRSADGTEYLWQGDEAYWKKRAPHLFPVCGRLTEGHCKMDGEDCRMDTHGFFRWRTLRCEQQSADQLLFALDTEPETREQYPRDWHAQVGYHLCEDTLQVTFRVKNCGTKRMWFAYGGHPGFQVPLAGGLSFEDYQLRFAPGAWPQKVEMSDTCFVKGGDTPLLQQGETILPLKHELFDRDAVFLRNTGGQVTLESTRDAHFVTVTFSDLPYLGLWHAPKTKAPYLCLEPWSALPDREGRVEELNCKPDMVCLPPQKSWQATWSIRCGKSKVLTNRC